MSDRIEKGRNVGAPGVFPSAPRVTDHAVGRQGGGALAEQKGGGRVIERAGIAGLGHRRDDELGRQREDQRALEFPRVTTRAAPGDALACDGEQAGLRFPSALQAG